MKKIQLGGIFISLCVYLSLNAQAVREIRMYNGTETLYPDTTYFFYDSGGHDFSGGSANNYQANENFQLIFKVPTGYELEIYNGTTDVAQGDVLMEKKGYNTLFTCDFNNDNISNDPGYGVVVTDTFNFMSNSDALVGKGWYKEITVNRHDRTNFALTSPSNSSFIYYQDTISNVAPFKLQWDAVNGATSYSVYLTVANRVQNYNTLGIPVTTFENMTDNQQCFLEAQAPFFTLINEFEVPTSVINGLCTGFNAGADRTAPMKFYWTVKANFNNGQVYNVGYSKFTIAKEGLVSVSEALKDQIRLFPNPTSGHLNLELKGTEPYKVRLKDLSGREVYSAFIHSESQTLDLSILKSGIYFCEIESEQGLRYTERILKMD